jgi:hypothetical protein
MLLTAQRVRSSEGKEGVNAFCYLHGAYTWDAEPPAGIPERVPGQRVNARTEIEPGGNDVRGYLDIIAPDETPTSEILAAVGPFVQRMHGTPLPWTATAGRCTFRFGLDRGLAGDWWDQLRALFIAAVRARVAA